MPWLTPLNHQVAHYYHQVGWGTWYQPACGGARSLPKAMLLPFLPERGQRQCQRCAKQAARDVARETGDAE